jgi:hypothetical protein
MNMKKKTASIIKNQKKTKLFNSFKRSQRTDPTGSSKGCSFGKL